MCDGLCDGDGLASQPWCKPHFTPESTVTRTRINQLLKMDVGHFCTHCKKMTFVLDHGRYFCEKQIVKK